MKITVLGPLSPRKGISAYVDGFVCALQKKAYVHVLDFSSMYPKSLYPGGDPKQQGKQTPHIWNGLHHPILARYNPFSRIRAGLLIQGDVLHMQYWIWFLAPMYITVGLFARFVKKIPVILTIHNVQPHEKVFWKTWIDKVVYSVADTFIVHSIDNKKQLQKIIGIEKDIHIFPHGIIMPEVEKGDQHSARSILHIAPEKKVLLCFGNIRSYKGIDTAIMALHQLGSDYHLIIAGKCREKWEKYQKIINDLGVQGSITRIDSFLDDHQVATVFSASDLLLLPYTHFDAQSGVVALGLGYEIPMLVSNLGGLTEVIDDEQYIWKSGCIDELVLKIQCINNQKAKTFINQRIKVFKWENIIENYFSVLNTVKSNKRKLHLFFN